MLANRSVAMNWSGALTQLRRVARTSGVQTGATKTVFDDQPRRRDHKNGVVQSAMPMRRLNSRLSCVLGLMWLLLLLAASTARAADVPAFQGPVNDNAELLSPLGRRHLAELLRAYQKETGHQLAFLSVTSLNGSDLDAYALRVAEAWKLGRKGVDDGLLMLVSKADHAVRVEVGYGLEDKIPDVVAARIQREVLVPAFRAYKFTWGVRAAFLQLIAAAEGTSSVDGADPVSDLLGFDHRALTQTVNDYAQVLGEVPARFSDELERFEQQSGLRYGVLTALCPSQVGLDQCSRAMGELWQSPLARSFDGVVCRFQQADNAEKSVMFTLTRLSNATRRFPKTTSADAAADVDAALHSLVVASGGYWAGLPTPPSAAADVEVRPVREISLTWIAILAGLAFSPFLIGLVVLRVRGLKGDGKRGVVETLTSDALTVLAGGDGTPDEDVATPGCHRAGERGRGSAGEPERSSDGDAGGGGRFGGGGSSEKW